MVESKHYFFADVCDLGRGPQSPKISIITLYFLALYNTISVYSEVSGTGVSISVVRPGGVATPGYEHATAPR